MFGNFQEQGKRNITNSRAPKIAKQEECWSYQMLRKKGLKLREKKTDRIQRSINQAVGWFYFSNNGSKTVEDIYIRKKENNSHPRLL